MRPITILLLVIHLSTGCATVRQSDLDAWTGVPVIALDTHSLLIALPMVRTITDSGIEIRNYSEKIGVSSCTGFGSELTNLAVGNTLPFSNFNAYQSCVSRLVGCDGIFYIRDGIVIEAKVAGQCYTNESYRPQPGWEKFLRK